MLQGGSPNTTCILLPPLQGFDGQFCMCVDHFKAQGPPVKPPEPDAMVLWVPCDPEGPTCSAGDGRTAPSCFPVFISSAKKGRLGPGLKSRCGLGESKTPGFLQLRCLKPAGLTQISPISDFSLAIELKSDAPFCEMNVGVRLAFFFYFKCERSFGFIYTPTSTPVRFYRPT